VQSTLSLREDSILNSIIEFPHLSFMKSSLIKNTKNADTLSKSMLNSKKEDVYEIYFNQMKEKLMKNDFDDHKIKIMQNMKNYPNMIPFSIGKSTVIGIVKEKSVWISEHINSSQGIKFNIYSKTSEYIYDTDITRHIKFLYDIFEPPFEDKPVITMHVIDSSGDYLVCSFTIYWFIARVKCSFSLLYYSLENVFKLLNKSNDGISITKEINKLCVELNAKYELVELNSKSKKSLLNLLWFDQL